MKKLLTFTNANIQKKIRNDKYHLEITKKSTTFVYKINTKNY